MHELYSSGLHRNQKVITVFVGGASMPSHRQCYAALTMDPEVEAPVLVVPFGGLPFEGAPDDDAAAMMVISQNTPQYVETGFYYRCTRVLGLLLVKVLVQRDFRHKSQSVHSGKGFADNLTLN